MLLKNIHGAIGVVLLISACAIVKKPSHNSPSVSTGSMNKKNSDTNTVYRASVKQENDIIHTKLDVSFDWKKQYLFGKATITVRPYFYSLTDLTLDAREMEIKEVFLVDSILNNPSLSYTYEKNKLKIKLNRTYKNTEKYTVHINYISKPNELKKSAGSQAITDDKGLYFINPLGDDKEKPQQIWTQGETESNSVWFPTIDSPNERMTHEIYITTEKKYLTLSNGELAYSIDNGDSTRTDCWKMNQPHAPYLVMMTVGDFAVVKDKWRDKEVNYYVEKEYEAYAKNIFGNTPEMIEFYSNKLGVDFPWNKYSQVVVRDYVSGAMENTSAALFGEFMQRTSRELLDRNYEHVVAHELFHEWFGDYVTCESWSNIPLNESFATYGEYLWEEYKYGLDAADFHSEESRNGYLSESSTKQVPLIRYHYATAEDVFDAHSYNKGGQILHMLRKYVGDEAFFASLKYYSETNKYASVEVHNLRLAFEKITGEDLNWFFNQWFLSPGHPVLEIKTNYDSIRKKMVIHISQNQDVTVTPIYRLPMAVDIYEKTGKTRHQIEINKQQQTIEISVNSRPLLVNIDADKATLCQKNEQKSIQEWAFQYQHAPLYMDRKEAIIGALALPDDTLKTNILINALSDKMWSIRKFAIAEIKKVEKGNENKINEILTKIAVSDSVAGVRNAALLYLSENNNDSGKLTFYKKILNEDKSYTVMSTALGAIAKIDLEKSIILCKAYELEKNKELLLAIAEIYSKKGDLKDNVFFIQTIDRLTGYAKAKAINTYGTYLKKIDNETELKNAIIKLEPIQSQKSNKWAANSAKRVIEEIETRLKTNQTK